MSDDQSQQQTVEVFGDLADVLPYTQPVYQRTIRTRAVTFTCQRCGRMVTQQRFPGPTPRYCSDGCRYWAQLMRTRERVQRFRMRQQEQGDRE
jgi:hypothetical protein